uniref:Uncharacterized protein n=1 Tax=Fagus sylvatica TaxID=28930 RepID=A0A2N9IW21_FAGSY
MLSKFKLAFVFVLICLPASQGQAGSPYVPNPTNPTTGTGDIASMITEKVFVTDHIDVSPFLLRRLLKSPGSVPNAPTYIPPKGPPTYIPPKGQNNKDHPSQGSMETSRTKGSNTIH